MDRGQGRPPGDRRARPAGQHRGRLKAALTALLVAALATQLGGCGYRFSVASGELPGGGRRLVVPAASFRGAEPWMAAFFTQALREQVDRAGLEWLTSGEGLPVLQARLDGAREIPRAVSNLGGRFRAREQEVDIRIALELTGGGQAPRQIVLRDRMSYLSAPDLRGTEANRHLAARKLLDKLARQAIERLARGF